MTVCTDNSRLDLTGCGATYNGRQQHSVARVGWSTHPDGRAHVTFTTETAADLCWRGDRMRDPATVTNRKGERLLTLGGRGVWKGAGSPPERVRVTRQSDANASEVSG